MKYFLFLFCLALISCGSNDEPGPDKMGPPSFVNPTSQLDVYATESHTIEIINFDEDNHYLRLNDIYLEHRVMETEGDVSRISITIPLRMGSGKIELMDDDVVAAEGPMITYHQRYLPLSIPNHWLGQAMCGFSNDNVITWDPLTRKLYVARFVNFQTSGDREYTFRGTQHPITYTGSGLTRRYLFTGMAYNGGPVTFYRMFEGAHFSDHIHRLITTSDRTTATDHAGGVATNHINEVYDLEQDSEGNLYTVEDSRLYIQKIYPAGLGIFAGSENSGSSDGANIDASFRRIRAITIDANDNLYVADSSRIRLITPAGVVSTLAGASTGDQDGSLNQARFGGLMGIAHAPNNELYVFDAFNSKFKVISADRQTVRTLKIIGDDLVLPIYRNRTTPMYVDSHGYIYYLGNENVLCMLMPEDSAPESVVTSFSDGLNWLGKFSLE